MADQRGTWPGTSVCRGWGCFCTAGGLCGRMTAGIRVSLWFSLLFPPWGKYAEETRCTTPQLVRSSSVVCDENSGPPSDVSVVGMPKVEKVSIRVALAPLTRQASRSICPPAPGMQIPHGGRNLHRCAGRGTPTGLGWLMAWGALPLHVGHLSLMAGVMPG